MDDSVKALIADSASPDDTVRMEAFDRLLEITEERVDWLPEVFDDLLARTEDPNSFQRSIAIMLLANLAKSDTGGLTGGVGDSVAGGLIEAALPRILSHTSDEKFITSRQCIQSLWKIAVVSERYREPIVAHLRERFVSCLADAHPNLLRRDIVVSLARIAAAGSAATAPGFGSGQPPAPAPENDPAGLWKMIDDLIGSESDAKYRKSYLRELGNLGLGRLTVPGAQLR